jgi:hypothetical protein
MGPRSLGAVLVLAVLAPMCAGHANRAPAPAAAATPAPTAVPTIPPTPTPTPAPAPAPAQDLFATSVRPMLEARCSPCHFPGGKMYERLSFDRAETLASRREGALKRLKGDDRAAFEAWLKTLP